MAAADQKELNGMNKIEEIKKSLREITQGKWELGDIHWHKGCQGKDCRQSIIVKGKRTVAVAFGAQYRATHNEDPRTEIAAPDAVFIANAPEYVQFLITELERVSEEYADERAAHNLHATELIEAEKENKKLREQRDAYYENAKYTEAAFHEVTMLRAQKQQLGVGLQRVEAEIENAISLLKEDAFEYADDVAEILASVRRTISATLTTCEEEKDAK